jgi:hypothetical protein
MRAAHAARDAASSSSCSTVGKIYTAAGFFHKSKSKPGLGIARTQGSQDNLRAENNNDVAQPLGVVG